MRSELPNVREAHGKTWVNHKCLSFAYHQAPISGFQESTVFVYETRKYSYPRGLSQRRVMLELSFAFVFACDFVFVFVFVFAFVIVIVFLFVFVIFQLVSSKPRGLTRSASHDKILIYNFLLIFVFYLWLCLVFFSRSLLARESWFTNDSC